MLRGFLKFVTALLVAGGVVLTVGSLGYWIGGGEVGLVALLGGPVLVVVSLRLFVAALGKNKIPDFLCEMYQGPFLNADGLAMVPSLADNDGYCWVEVYYQNQYEGRCTAIVTLKAASGSFFAGDQGDRVAFELEVSAGEFGRACLPIAIPLEYQGTAQEMEVFADVDYPEGRGARLLIRDGTSVESSDTDFKESEYVLIKAITLGNLSLKRPARLTAVLPEHVASEPPEVREVTVDVFWRVGDSPNVDELMASIRTGSRASSIQV